MFIVNQHIYSRWSTGYLAKRSIATWVSIPAHFEKKVRSLIVTLKLCKVDNNIIKTLLVKVTKGTSLIISIIILKHISFVRIIHGM